MQKVHTYRRSRATFRVRVAMNLKGLKADAIYVHLDKGDQYTDAYRTVNSQSVVPALVLDDATVLTQSLPIIEYLEEVHPEPRLFLKFFTPTPLIGTWCSLPRLLACR